MRSLLRIFNRYTIRDNLNRTYGYYFFRSSAIILWGELTLAFPHATFEVIRITH